MITIILELSTTYSMTQIGVDTDMGPIVRHPVTVISTDYHYSVIAAMSWCTIALYQTGPKTVYANRHASV